MTTGSRCFSAVNGASCRCTSANACCLYVRSQAGDCGRISETTLHAVEQHQAANCTLPSIQQTFTHRTGASERTMDSSSVLSGCASTLCCASPSALYYIYNHGGPAVPSRHVSTAFAALPLKFACPGLAILYTAPHLCLVVHLDGLQLGDDLHAWHGCTLLINVPGSSSSSSRRRFARPGGLPQAPCGAFNRDVP
jgi:hypothetical protein